MSSAANFSELRPGDSIYFDDITQVPQFENQLVSLIEPTLSPIMRANWMARVGVSGLLRPPRFQGNFTDIQLRVMNEPYRRLLDARSRGWQFSRQERGPNQPSTDSDIVDSYRAFIFNADARKGGQGVVGRIHAELWYGKEPNLDAYRRPNGVRRHVTHPRFESPLPEGQKTQLIDTTTRHIGFSALQWDALYPIR